MFTAGPPAAACTPACPFPLTVGGVSASGVSPCWVAKGLWEWWGGGVVGRWGDGTAAADAVDVYTDHEKTFPLIVLIQSSIKLTNKKWSATSSNPKSAEAPKQLPSGMKLLRIPKRALKLLSSPTKEEGPVLPNAHWRRQTSADKSWKRLWRGCLSGSASNNKHSSQRVANNQVTFL